MKLSSVLSICLIASTGWAAIPPLEPDALRRTADVVIVGGIEDFSSVETRRKNGLEQTHFAVQVKVHAVEKGVPSLAGKTITVHGWNVRSMPAGWTGPSGHHTIDYDQTLRQILQCSAKAPVRARFYLSVREKEKHILLEPNGLEVIEPER